ncbi:MAG: hypothetical protein ACTSR2_02545 [Candidatus Hodarchaeales archaeon]
MVRTDGIPEFNLIGNDGIYGVGVNENNELKTLTTVSGGNIEISRYRPRFYTSKSDISIPSNSEDTTLATIEGDGQIDFISVKYSSDEAQFVLEIDGTEVLRIDVDDLNNSNEYSLGSNAWGVYGNIYDVGTVNDRHILIRWDSPVDFTSSVIIKSRKRNIASVSMNAILVRWREKIT